MNNEPLVITKKSAIGEVFSKYPETEPVFQKYFGSGCFTCPGSKIEDIAFGAMMHNIEPEEMIEELNEAIKSGDEGEGEVI